MIQDWDELVSQEGRHLGRPISCADGHDGIANQSRMDACAAVFHQYGVRGYFTVQRGLGLRSSVVAIYPTTELVETLAMAGVFESRFAVTRGLLNALA